VLKLIDPEDCGLSFNLKTDGTSAAFVVAVTSFTLATVVEFKKDKDIRPQNTNKDGIKMLIFLKKQLIYIYYIL
jgi:hypothetical protein